MDEYLRIRDARDTTPLNDTPGAGYGSTAPPNDTPELADDRQPVCAHFEVATLRRLLLERVDAEPGAQADVQRAVVAPLWRDACARCGVRPGDMRRGRRGGPLASAALMYAALASRDYFLALAAGAHAQADGHASRADVAESLAILGARALHQRGALADALCAKFTPVDVDTMRADPARWPVRGTRHMSLLAPGQRARVYRLGGGAAHGGLLAERALEVAIRCEAKRFTAQKAVGEVVRMLWDGSLHWKGFRCVSLSASGASSPSLSSAMRRASSSSLSSAADDGNARLDCLRSRLERWLARALEPLRIPMFENVLAMVHAFFFLTLYTAVSLQRQAALSPAEALLHVCALAYIADEARQCRESGVAVYLKSVWNVLDVAIYSVFAAFLCLRARSLCTGDARDVDKAYDVLALNASMLWPRLFAVLDQVEFCGTIIIQVRRIISGTSLFFALLVVMVAGFFQTFYALGARHSELSAQGVWGLMARVFFGAALLGWDQAALFGPHVGSLAMATYIAVSMLILYNILIGVINQCMVEIERNAAHEFRFAFTMRVAEYASARQTYPCVPPLNLLHLVVFWPLRRSPLLTPRAFRLFRCLLLLVAYAPHLAAYAAYSRIAAWCRCREGLHGSALLDECHAADQDLALIKLEAHDIDELAFAAHHQDLPDPLASAQTVAERWSARVDVWKQPHPEDSR
ncbi:hypothetical protein H4S02_003501 [Coemansia sp. RSA 2611]|nr:hypothetical protein H4S02_003501 [Coemansia sp. RSA 2611]